MYPVFFPVGTKPFLPMSKKDKKAQGKKQEIRPADWWPGAFFLLILLTAALVPLARYKVDFIWSKMFLLNIFTLIGLGLWLFRIHRDQALRLPAAYTLFPFLFLCLTFLLSATKAVNIYKSELTLAYQIGNFFLFLLLLANFRDEKWIDSIFLAMGIATLLATIYGLLQFFEFSYLPRDQYDEKDPATFLGLSNFAAEYMLTVFPLLIAMVFRKLHTRAPFSAHHLAILIAGAFLMLLFQRISKDFNNKDFVAIFLIFIVCTVPLFVGHYLVDICTLLGWIGLIALYLLASQYRAGYVSLIWLAAFLPALVIFWRMKMKLPIPWKKLAVGAAVLLILLTASLKLTEPGRVAGRKFTRLMGEVIKMGSGETAPRGDRGILHYTNFRDASIRFRLATWPICLKIFSENPLLGVGVGNIQVLFAKHQNRELEEMTLEANTRVIDIHNDYIQTFTEAGIVGGVGMLAVLGAILLLARFLLRRTEDPGRFWIVAGALGGITALLVDILFSFGMRLPASSMNFWILLAILEVLALRDRPGADHKYSLRFTGILRAAVIVAFIASAVVTVITIDYSRRSVLADYYYRQGQAFKRLERHNDALASFKRSIELIPNEERAYFDRFISYMKLGDDRMAIEDLRQVTKFMPFFGPARRHLGYLFARQGQVDEAIREFETALELMPSRMPTLYPMMFPLYLRKGDFQRAIEVGEFIREDRGNDPKFLFGLGNAYVAARRYQEARAVFEQIIKIDPGITLAHTNLAVTLLNMNEIEPALRELDTALRQDPESAPSWYNLAIAHAFRKDEAGARKALAKAISLHSDYRRTAEGDPTLKNYLPR